MTDPKTSDRERRALEAAFIDADARAAIAQRRAQSLFLQPVLTAAGVVRDDASGRKVVRYEHRNGWLDADEYLDALRLEPDFAPAFADARSPNAGQPAKPAYTRPNPFAKRTFSLTEQMRLQKTDPELAARLKSEAL